MDLEKLKEILKNHKKWNDGEGGERADLREADLRRADLQEADLREADLRRADLQEADLRRADLRRAHLEGAHLEGAHLEGASLRGASLEGASLEGANLRGAHLEGAHLEGAKGISPQYYSDTYSLKSQKTVICYRAFNKNGESPIQNFDWGKITKGRVLTAACNTNERQECGAGVNLATLQWVLKNHPDCEIWQFEANGGDLIIPHFSDGKFRAPSATAIRKISKKEIADFLESGTYPKVR